MLRFILATKNLLQNFLTKLHVNRAQDVKENQQLYDGYVKNVSSQVRCTEQWMVHKALTTLLRRVWCCHGYRIRACSPKCSPFPILRICFWCPFTFLVTRTWREKKHMKGVIQYIYVVWYKHHLKMSLWTQSDSTLPLLLGWCRMCLLLLLLELWHLCPGTSPDKWHNNVSKILC